MRQFLDWLVGCIFCTIIYAGGLLYLYMRGGWSSVIKGLIALMAFKLFWAVVIDRPKWMNDALNRLLRHG